MSQKKLTAPKPRNSRTPKNPPPKNEAANDNQQNDPLQSEPQTTMQPMTTASPLPQELQAPEASSPGTSSGDHLAALSDIVADEPLPDGGADIGVDGGAPVAGLTPEGLIDRDTFRKTFFGSFKVAGTFLTALSIKPDEVEAANAASDAIYETCCEIHWLHFLLKPGGVWIPRLMAIYFFAQPKAVAVMAEIAARKEAARVAHETAQAA